MEVNERKDFPEWAVTAVYLAQDGICNNCGGSLERGFHRHHADNNRSNNSVGNLSLVCAECHRATFAEAGWKEHKEQERKVLENINKAIELTMSKEVPGTSLERITEAAVLSLKTSRSLHSLDKGIEYPPPSIMAFKRFLESKAIQEYIVDGYKAGMKAAIDVSNAVIDELSYDRGRADERKENNASSVESTVAS